MTTTTFSTRYAASIAATACLALLALTSCTNEDANLTDLQTRGNAYISANLSSITPAGTASSNLRVKSIEWQDDDTAIVTYTNGSTDVRGTTDVRLNGTVVSATRLRVVSEDGSSSSKTSSSEQSSRSSVRTSMSSMMSSLWSSLSSMRSSSATSGRPLSKEGEFCGGIAAFQCEAGLRCQFDGTYPDAGGTCIR